LIGLVKKRFWHKSLKGFNFYIIKGYDLEQLHRQRYQVTIINIPWIYYINFNQNRASTNSFVHSANIFPKNISSRCPCLQQ
jgi:hypothetical protein